MVRFFINGLVLAVVLTSPVIIAAEKPSESVAVLAEQLNAESYEDRKSAIETLIKIAKRDVTPLERFVKDHPKHLQEHTLKRLIDVFMDDGITASDGIKVRLMPVQKKLELSPTRSAEITIVFINQSDKQQTLPIYASPSIQDNAVVPDLGGMLQLKHGNTTLYSLSAFT